MAALTEDGSVEIWKLKGQDAKYQWGLNFNSVTDIEANSSVENQFFVLMSSKEATDEPTPPQDSLLLF